MPRKRKDLLNKTFGYVLVIDRAEDYISPQSKRVHARWKCKCSYEGCNNIFITYQQQLLSGNTISCPECANKIMALKKIKKNEYEFTSDVCIGYTNKGEIFVVDIEDYDKIKDYTWHYNRNGYVQSTTPNNDGQKFILLSRLIMGFPQGMDVDHIHGTQSLCDNRKENLRICPHSLNCFNKSKRSDSNNDFKGVYKKKNGKYRVNITAFGVRYWIGTFDTLQEAKDAYNQKALELHGQYAKLN